MPQKIISITNIVLLALVSISVATSATTAQDTCILPELNSKGEIDNFTLEWNKYENGNCRLENDIKYKELLENPSGDAFWKDGDENEGLAGIDGAANLRGWMIRELQFLTGRLKTSQDLSTHHAYKQELSKILTMLDITILQTKASLDPDDSSKGRLRWELDEDFEIQLDGSDNDYKIKLLEYLQRSCLDASSCKLAGQEFIQITMFAMDAAHIVGKWYSGPTVETVNAIKENADLWVKYRTEKKPMFWWEAALNEAVHHTPYEGTQRPPNYQWILLHPAPSFEYVGGSTSSGIKPGISLEVLGINAWKWKDGKMAAPFGIPYLKALGVSAVINYSERDEFNDLSYGGMLHFNHTFSIGVTRGKGPNGGVTKVMFTADILKLFESKSEKAKKLEKDLRKLRQRW
jgi:hypothetical protein